MAEPLTPDEGARWGWAADFAREVRRLYHGAHEEALRAQPVVGLQVTSDQDGTALVEDFTLPTAASMVETSPGEWDLAYGRTGEAIELSRLFDQDAGELSAIDPEAVFSGTGPAGVVTAAVKSSPQRRCLGYLLFGDRLVVYAHDRIPRDPSGLPDFRSLLGVQRPKKGSRARLSPGALPFQTGEETRALTEAIASGRHGIGYEFIPPEQSGGRATARYRHPARPSSHEVRITPPDGQPWGVSELKAMTRNWDFACVHVSKVVTSMLAVNAEKHADGIARGEVKPSITVDVDEILEVMGKRREDGAAKWNQERCMVRQRLLEMSNAAVVGRRKGTYLDKTTGQVIDTYQSEALFVLHDQETEWLYGQRSFDGSGIPVRLVIVGGSLFQWLARYGQMRQYIGEVRTLARLPVGQPSGQWAAVILCAVLQKAKEKRTHQFEMSREELLLSIPPDETPQQLWDKGKTQRIKPRWKDAARLLAGIGITLTEPPTLGVTRGWLGPYLEQKVGVTVSTELVGEADLPALAATAEAHATREAKPKRKPGRPRKKAA